MHNGNWRVYKSKAQPAEILDLVSGLIAISLLVLVTANAGGPVRIVLTLLFAFFVPGRAVVSNWPGLANWSDVGMSIALSLGILSLLATVTLWARLWQPFVLFDLEAALSIVGLGLAIVRRRRAVDHRDPGLGWRDPASSTRIDNRYYSAEMSRLQNPGRVRSFPPDTDQPPN
jgi:uncharacterized membrane protein